MVNEIVGYNNYGAMAAYEVPNLNLKESISNRWFSNRFTDADTKARIQNMSISDLPRGSVITLSSIPGTNTIFAFTILFVPGVEGTPSYLVGNKDSGLGFDTGYYFSAGVMSFHGEVLRKTANGMVMNFNPPLPDGTPDPVYNRHLYYKDKGDRFFIYDSERDELKIDATWRDVRAGDMLFSLGYSASSHMTNVVYR